MKQQVVEYRNMSVADLHGSIAAEERELQRLKFAHAITPLADPSRITKTRKAIATMKTILSERVAESLSTKIASGEITLENIYAHLGKGEYPITLRKSRVKSLFAQHGK